MIRLYTIFHLNIAYSSIEEDQRSEIIRKCYWPLLHLARKSSLPLGIEASGYTLESIAALDPAWVNELRELTSGGACEFIGSGYAQIIGPLVPAKVNAANLRIGNTVYERFLGFRPAIALVNEQAYSPGLIRHYLEAGYRAIIMEWHNPALYHPEWDKEWRFMPQIACGQNGERIPVIWNNAIAFQKFQRYAHGEIELQEYMEYLGGHPSDTVRVFPLYGNDVEIFDFRPGRYHTEAQLSEESEWNRIGRLFDALLKDDRFTCIRLSQVLDHITNPGAGNLIHLESPEQPVPVKKQGKYNIIRWAVTGKDDLGINTACMRIYNHLMAGNIQDETDWKELCYAWSSDFRTHITEKRWGTYLERLAAFENRIGIARPAGNQVWCRHTVEGKTEFSGNADFSLGRDGRFLNLESSLAKARLNCARGLAIDSMWFKEVSEKPLFGTLHHGYYDDISYGADFYTGHIILERPLSPKVTDLVSTDPKISISDSGDKACVSADIRTEFGSVRKTVILHRETPVLELIYEFDLEDIAGSTLRIGNITLIPEGFDKQSLFFSTHNGGTLAETCYVKGHEIDHPKSVSSLVSASYALGITENIVEMGDAHKVLTIDIDRGSCSLIGLVTYREISDTFFCRLALSASETDDTVPRTTTPAREFAYTIRMKISCHTPST
ncbi:MAG TPA: glycoside hydrolase family 57 [Deltaproteobacteria bacterium]|nr:glycoside hydrolase family 57 [Deltaproteobacteria bacterium]HPR53749.1 glycoside hydrolase family 57 [Deltaproteobacteria bacterium]HXK46766.1 glycoside hydrolase family 57 [Deltaproteobacteria bacterium]